MDPDSTIWLGGGTASGKSTVARVLAGRYGLRCLRIDDFWYAHDAALKTPFRTPDEQWIAMSAENQAAEFEEVSRARMKLATKELEQLPDRPGVLVEGPQVMPDLLVPTAHAIFLVPEQSFQRAHLSRRPMPPTSDTHRALENRIEKDRLHAARIAQLAESCGFPRITVDGSRSSLEIADAVAALLEPTVCVGGTVDEVAEARRWENGVFVENVRSWLASPDAPPRPPTQYGFSCECGTRGCSEIVQLSLARYDALPAVLAPAHE